MRKAILAALLLLACGAARADDAATHPAYWGSPSVDGGKYCVSLAEVRDNIDRIDHAIVALMAERAKYVAEAGRFKPDPPPSAPPPGSTRSSPKCGLTLRARASTRRSPTRPIGR